MITALLAWLTVLPMQDPYAPTPAASAAMGHYLQCFATEANRIDDGVSDAATIGRAIAPLCTEERIAAAKAIAEGRARYEAMAIAQLKNQAPEAATRVVLQERLRRRLRAQSK